MEKENQKIRIELQTIIKTKGVKQSFIANQVKMDKSNFSNFLNGNKQIGIKKLADVRLFLDNY